MTGPSLVDFAQLLTIWVLALQYFMNTYGRQLRVDYRQRMGDTSEDAHARGERLVMVTQGLVMLLLLVACVLGGIGWFGG